MLLTSYLLGKRELAALFSSVCGMCTVCHGLFALPLGVICRLCSVIVAIPGHVLYIFVQDKYEVKMSQYVM